MATPVASPAQARRYVLRTPEPLGAMAQGSLYTTAELAQRLRAPEETIRHWLRTGALRGLKLGRRWRVREEDLKSFEKAREGGSVEEALPPAEPKGRPRRRAPALLNDLRAPSPSPGLDLAPLMEKGAEPGAGGTAEVRRGRP